MTWGQTVITRGQVTRCAPSTVCIVSWGEKWALHLIFGKNYAVPRHSSIGISVKYPCDLRPNGDLWRSGRSLCTMNMIIPVFECLNQCGKFNREYLRWYLFFSKPGHSVTCWGQPDVLSAKCSKTWTLLIGPTICCEFQRNRTVNSEYEFGWCTF